MSCCPPGSWPKFNSDYKPVGKKFKLENGADVYHVGQGKRVLIILSDIFGIQSGFHQGVSDTYAQLGYNVYLPQILPEVFNDPDLSKIVPYIKGLNNQTMNKIFNQLISFIQKQGYKQYFLAGFCWGVWKIFDLSKDGHQGIVAFAGFHPSVVAENLHGGNDVELSKKIKHPGFLYPAGNDVPNIKQGGEIVKIMEQKFGADKCGTLTFPDMTHGWVVRGQNQLVERDREKAIEHSHAYFSKFEI